MNKLVTVLMSVHNEKREYLQTAINSIVAQTYKNIEFLIIDDASDSECHEILEEIISPYSYIKLMVNEQNMGITKSLYNGVKQARGDFIARMDADDFSLPTRLETQVRFLEENPQIDILGGAVVSFGAKSVFMSPCSGMDDAEIKSELFFTSALCHPAVMIRKSFLQQYDLNYDQIVNKGQDYDFWERCSVYGRFKILKDVVLYYRIHDKQITSQNKSEQVQTAEMVMKRRLSRISLKPTAEEYNAHLALKGTGNCDNLSQVKNWAEKLITANAKAGFVDGKTFEKNIRKRLSILCAKNKKVRGRDVIPLIQYGKERIAMKFRLKREKVYVSQI
ncbi:glycosyltransferase [Enterocloster clostridioformis]|uniref:glycosyltransferase n=1 Tax=Enterocloster clostridioformis TaxID=1531 RepID=UPI00156DBB53|nr:glycosyltransferase [Enterocloster clostridioformis]NSJ55787.1 glycosyltransferase [Enterocloster clostridioformis]